MCITKLLVIYFLLLGYKSEGNIHEKMNVFFRNDRHLLRDTLFVGRYNDVRKKWNVAWNSKTVLLTLDDTCSFPSIA
jgi:hypothetical protein